MIDEIDVMRQIEDIFKVYHEQEEFVDRDPEGNIIYNIPIPRTYAVVEFFARKYTPYLVSCDSIDTSRINKILLASNGIDSNGH